MAVKLETFIELLKAALEFGASDIHIREGESPCFRIRGDLVPIKSPPVSKSDVQSISKILIDDEVITQNLDSLNELDGGHDFNDICRVRYNFFRFQKKIGLILRLIKTDIPSIKELGLPRSVKKIAEHRWGLVLLTGATGSGKSTTMAAIINHINRNKQAHIITIEDPIEYVFKPKNCRITQREVGRDTNDFRVALRAALRQDPDVIAIGEMRDAETVDICLKAAETGHLVISTIHTNNAENTIGRIIAMFPPEAQQDARHRLSENLHATISQRMLKRADNEGVVISQEIMVSSPGIKACITGKEDWKNFHTYIREGYGPGGNGSQTFDQNLRSLLKNKLITKETAINFAANSGDFAKILELED